MCLGQKIVIVDNKKMSIYIYSVDDLCIKFPWTVHKGLLVFENTRTAHWSRNSMIGSIFLVSVEVKEPLPLQNSHSQILSSAPVLHESIQIKNNPFVTDFFFFFAIWIYKKMDLPKMMQLQVKGNVLQH